MKSPEQTLLPNRFWHLLLGIFLCFNVQTGYAESSIDFNESLKYLSSEPRISNGEITCFSLNKQDGSSLITLQNGVTFCESEFSRNIRIRTCQTGSHESLIFTITGPFGTVTNLENVVNYDSREFSPTSGNYTIQAELFEGPNGTGTRLDIETISFNVQSCNNNCNVDGGSLAGGPFEFCIDGQDDFIPAGGIVLTPGTGTNRGWIVTDDAGLILGLPPTFTAVNFEDAGLGTCNVYYIRYENGLQGLNAGNNINNLQGCYDLSNPVIVNRINCNNGCNANVATNGNSISVTGLNSAFNQVQITDANFNIIYSCDNFGISNNLCANPESFNAPSNGTYYVFVRTYTASFSVVCDIFEPVNVTGGGGNTGGNTGCNVDGGSLAGGPFSFCVDGVPDNIPVNGIVLTPGSGSNRGWVITDDNGNILGLPPTFSAVNFDEAGAGSCYVYYIRYENGLQGLAPGNNINNLQGCFDLSNFVEVIREIPDGGTVLLANGGGTTYTGCAGDIVIDLTFTTTAPNLSYWYIITDDQNVILDFMNSNNGNTIDLSGVAPGECRVWGWSYRGLSDPIRGQSVFTLNDDACEDISDGWLTVIREDCPPGGGNGGDNGSVCDITFSTGLDYVQIDGAVGPFPYVGVFDNRGNVIFECHAFNGGCPTTVRVDNLDPGVYWVNANVADNNFSTLCQNSQDIRLGLGSRIAVENAEISETKQKENVLYEEKAIADFSVYPNPASESVTVSLGDYIGKDINIQFINQLGQIVNAIQLDNVEDTSYTIGLNGFNGGIYSVLILSEDTKPMAKKMIVNK